MSDPRVTALLPVKRFQRLFLERAVGSLLAQTSPSWRLILVHEGRTRELRRALGAALVDGRVRLVRNEGRKLSGALNTGMQHATTDFTAILLGDDMWAPEAVELLGAYIERFPDVDFFHSSRAIIDEHDHPLSGVHRAKETFALDAFVRGSPVKHLLCWRREKALAIGGFDETLNSVGPDDYDFPWTMAEAGARFRAIPDCLYLYRDHRESFRLTTHLSRSHHVRELERILRKHRVEEERIAEAIASAEQGFLRQCLYRSGPERWLKVLLRYDPRRGWRETYR